MSATEVREKYGDLLKQGKLKEIQEHIEAQDIEEPAPADRDADSRETFHRVGEFFSSDYLNRFLQHPDIPEEAKKVVKEFMDRKDTTDRQTLINESMRKSAEFVNKSSGNLHLLDGINCPLCKNRGYTEKVEQLEKTKYCRSVLVECECMKKRRSWQKIQNSGLARVLSEQTFDTFNVETPWQRNVRDKAREFVDGKGGMSFYIGGQVGSGKSHICTAICGEFLNRNMSVRYMKWADESVRLKAMVNDDEYDSLLSNFRKCDVLYIDDFFKVARNGNSSNIQPSAADIKLAFQIIDYRYCNKLSTVISSEWFMDEIMDFDEAVSSRIYEMCKGSMVQIPRDRKRNYRRRMIQEMVRQETENPVREEGKDNPANSSPRAERN